MHERFHALCIPEPNTGCTLWMGLVDKNGYGVMYDPRTKRHIRVTHLALEMAGRNRWGNMNALHTCDVTGCVNADHLYWGTQSDNNNDSVRRGRWGDRKPIAGIGEKHYLARLDAESVRQIRNMLKDGATQTMAAFVFGVSRGTISDVALGRTWRHVQ